MSRYADTTQQLLPKAQRQKTNRTTFAFKYSHPIGVSHGVSHHSLMHTGKSGLTPISATKNPITPSRAYREFRKARHRRYQARRFFGFTVAELDALEASAHLDPELMVEDTLRCPLHPLFVRERWETRAGMPRQMGPAPVRGEADVEWDPERGYWLAENPVIWNVLRPCLIVASSLLFSAHIYPWWDALINGERDPIPLERCPDTHLDPEHPLMRFRQRPGHIAGDPVAQAKVKHILHHKLPSVVRLRLYSGYEHPKNGIVQSGTHGYGLTCTSSVDRYIWINIALEMLQPLLRDDLSDTERMLCQFKVAQTLIHESAHALSNMLNIERGSQSPYEPFFEDEILNELGFSLTDKLFEGEPYEAINPHLSRGGPGLPSSCTFRTNWFTLASAHYNGSNITVLKFVDRPGHPFNRHDHFPIPTSWVKSLYDDDMWTTSVQRYGSAATAMGPLTYGSATEILSNIDKTTGNPIAKSKAFHIFVSPNMLQASPLASSNENFLQLEEQRREKAQRIIHLVGKPQGIQCPPSPDPKNGYDDSDFPITYSCPRYDEIKAYLLRNRHHEQLALDSMDFDMPERTLYRYIIDRGGIALTPLEFRSFLYTASWRQELFFYTPFPGLGTVTRLPTGWPDDGPPPAIEMKAPPVLSHLKFCVRALVADSAAESLYCEFGNFRDFDFESLRTIINNALDGRTVINEGDFALVVNEIARSYPDVLTLGPKNIVRLRIEYPPSVRDAQDSPYARRKRLVNIGQIQDALLQKAEMLVPRGDDMNDDDGFVDVGVWDPMEHSDLDSLGSLSHVDDLGFALDNALLDGVEFGTTTL